MENELNNKKRLVVWLPTELHNIIKGRAAFRGMRIREWIELAIKERLKEEMKYE